MNAKPLGAKAYGSIPHLPGSRLGQGDHHVHEGSARIATVQTRDRHDVVYVEEKLDGSCCAVARLADEPGMTCTGPIVALVRAGYLAQSSRYEQHQLFAAWVRANVRLFEFLEPGERVVGEWLAQAHGTRYDLAGRQPFVAFDIMRGMERAGRREFRDRTIALATPSVLSTGPACSVEEAMSRLETYGSYGALDPVEGAVWRVERDDVVDFLCKYVRPDKIDGRYLPDSPEGHAAGVQAPVWNWRP